MTLKEAYKNLEAKEGKRITRAEFLQRVVKEGRSTLCELNNKKSSRWTMGQEWIELIIRGKAKNVDPFKKQMVAKCLNVNVDQLNWLDS